MFEHLPLHPDAQKLRDQIQKQDQKQRKRKALALGRTHLVKRNSPASWLGEFIPIDYDEAIMFGPVYEKDATEYGEHITHALYGNVETSSVHLRLHKGRCLAVDVNVNHKFFKDLLQFAYLPPLPANKIVEIVWTSIATAMSRLNVDPVSLARESLAHGRFKIDYPEPWDFALGAKDYSLFRASRG
jgi:hypothetical protein